MPLSVTLTNRNDAINITDILSPSSATPLVESRHITQTSETNSLELKPRQPNLQDLDALFGFLHIGEFSVSRIELHAMGAMINGELVTSTNTYFAIPDQVFIDSLEFDPAKVEQRIKAVEVHQSHIPATLLFEIATQRSTTAPPLLKESDASTVPVQKIGSLLKSTQRLDINKNPLPDHLPAWIDRTKSYGMSSMGVGLQAYGLYSAIIGTAEAIKKGHWDEAAINVGGGAAEIGSLIIERGLAKTGEAMIRSGAKTFEHFGRTTVGQVLSRGAGLMASVLTLPFDLYTAIKSFNDAADAKGKEAQDHYFNAALSLTSAGLSTILGCAALLGFKAAGPVGIAAAAILIVGARIYGAARTVDDIDDYIELSMHERWRAGWFAFTGQNQDKEVLDRFAVAKTYSDYAKALDSTSTDWLKNELKDSVEAVVNGRYEVQLQPTRHHKFEWDEASGEPSFVTVNVPVIKETDDVYDATEGLPTGIPNALVGETGPSKGVLWQLGGGNDSIIGVRSKPNYFSYSSGIKTLKGGEKHDSFLFQSAAQSLKKAPPTGQVNTLRGGAGTDTLSLQGKHVPVRHGPDDTFYVGYDVDLKSGKLGLRSPDTATAPVLHSNIHSIEKVETLAGAYNLVTGSDEADYIIANGHDRINAGAGDDQIVIRGNDCRVNGGRGADTYYLNGMTHSVSIAEDGQDLSVIHLGVTLERVQDWHIRENALVISSLQNTESFQPERQLVINDVYETLTDKRSLRNHRLLFITEDGYQLKADLPAVINGLTEQRVKVIVVVMGTPKTPPIIVNSRVQRVPSTKHSSYFVARETYRTVFFVDTPDSHTSSILYVDFDSDEITEINAIYTVTSTPRHSFSYLNYSNTHFQISFKNASSLLIHGSVEEDPGKKTDRGAGIMSSGWKSVHSFTLVMRNGKSYWLDFPENAYLDDNKHPGYRVIDSTGSLREKPGKYVFAKPTCDRRLLKAVPQRVDIDSVSHSSVYSLEGQASSYDLYPTDNTSLRLSTPGAAAKTSSGSTWNIYTLRLAENITRDGINIKNNFLKIGSVHIQLPNTEVSDIPLETINVIVSSGSHYRIDPLFEVAVLHTLNANRYPSIAAIVSDIIKHKRNDGLVAELISIENLRTNDATPGNIYYDTEIDNWTIDTDWSRSLRVENLEIVD
ncbi:calcium-binding protein [Pseudomonas frederiksbergensis]|uniref:calcium-binding protein n=1 Tax=Pseudomonas frederiksbergensis TaxID=104087 RepID=UPI003D99B500